MNRHLLCLLCLLITICGSSNAFGGEVDNFLLEKVPGLRIVTRRMVVDCGTGKMYILATELPRTVPPSVRFDGGYTSSGMELILLDGQVIAVDIEGNAAHLPISALRISAIGPGNQGHGSKDGKRFNVTVTDKPAIETSVRTEEEATSDALVLSRVVQSDGEWRFRNDPNRSTYKVFHTPICGKEVEMIAAGSGRVESLLPGPLLVVSVPLKW